MKTKPTTNSIAIVAIVLLSVIIIQARCNGQTFELQNGTKTGHAFTTKSGTISALHVGGLAFDYYYPGMDLMIDTRSKSDQGYSTSDRPPAYFIDRRGKRHKIEAIGKHHLHTVTSMRFFPGESGMPIFASDGSVCCVVLGNAFLNGRWKGRAARIEPLLESIRSNTDTERSK